METKDIRWQQRFYNFKKGFSHLSIAIEQEQLNYLESLGLIHTFEYVYELAWKTLQDYLSYQGYVKAKGPRASIQQAFKDGLIEDGMLWMEMLKKRELTGHTYIESTNEDLIESIRLRYADAFKTLIVYLERQLEE